MSIAEKITLQTAQDHLRNIAQRHRSSDYRWLIGHWDGRKHARAQEAEFNCGDGQNAIPVIIPSELASQVKINDHLGEHAEITSDGVFVTKVRFFYSKIGVEV